MALSSLAGCVFVCVQRHRSTCHRALSSNAPTLQRSLFGCITIVSAPRVRCVHIIHEPEHRQRTNRCGNRDFLPSIWVCGSSICGRHWRQRMEILARGPRLHFDSNARTMRSILTCVNAGDTFHIIINNNHGIWLDIWFDIWRTCPDLVRFDQIIHPCVLFFCVYKSIGIWY